MRDLFGGPLDAPSGAGTVHVRHDLPHADRARLRRAAAGQEAKILAWFREHPEAGLTPFEVQATVPGLESCPITSIRRALTNLTKAGHLERTEEQRTGRYGIANYLWRLRKS